MKKINVLVGEMSTSLQLVSGGIETELSATFRCEQVGEYEPEYRFVFRLGGLLSLDLDDKEFDKVCHVIDCMKQARKDSKEPGNPGVL